MNTTDLFSKAVLIKELGMFLVQISFEYQMNNRTECDCLQLQAFIQDRWNQFSAISGVCVKVIPDCSQIEGYEIILHLENDPLVLVSACFNLSH